MVHFVVQDVNRCHTNPYHNSSQQDTYVHKMRGRTKKRIDERQMSSYTQSREVDIIDRKDKIFYKTTDTKTMQL